MCGRFLKAMNPQRFIKVAALQSYLTYFFLIVYILWYIWFVFCSTTFINLQRQQGVQANKQAVFSLRTHTYVKAKHNSLTGVM